MQIRRSVDWGRMAAKLVFVLVAGAAVPAWAVTTGESETETDSGGLDSSTGTDGTEGGSTGDTEATTGSTGGESSSTGECLLLPITTGECTDPTFDPSTSSEGSASNTDTTASTTEPGTDTSGDEGGSTGSTVSGGGGDDDDDKGGCGCSSDPSAGDVAPLFVAIAWIVRRRRAR